MQKNALYKNMPSSDSSNFAAVFEKSPSESPRNLGRNYSQSKTLQK